MRESIIYVAVLLVGFAWLYVAVRIGSLAWYRSKAEYDKGFVKPVNGERDAKK